MLETHTDTNKGINDEQYRNIFKKTEKIVCAVFYLLRQNEYKRDNDVLISETEKTSSGLLSAALSVLNNTERGGDTQIVAMREHLVGLLSRLRVLHAAHLLSPEFLNVFVQEIDGVLRSLKTYSKDIGSEALSVFGDASFMGTHNRAADKVRAPSKVSARINRGVNGSGTQKRSDRIVDFLKANEESSVKDVADVVTECSEKTIQRELSTLIKDGIVKREGQRRWSRYSLL